MQTISEETLEKLNQKIKELAELTKSLEKSLDSIQEQPLSFKDSANLELIGTLLRNKSKVIISLQHAYINAKEEE